MATISEMVVKITADNSGLNKGVDDATKKVEDLGQKTQTTGQKFEAIKPQVMIATAAFAGAAVAIVKMVGDFADAEASFLRLDAAARLSGVPDATDEIADLATEIQKTTGASGDLVIQLGAELLAQGKSLDQTKKIITAASSLTAVQGDLSTNVKTLSGTYAGVTRELGKNIPEIKNMTKEQLANGDAVALITQKYGAFSKEMSDSTLVSTQRFSENMGDISELIGSVFAPALKEGQNFISGLIEGVVSASGAYGDWKDQMELWLIENATVMKSQEQLDRINQINIRTQQAATGAINAFMEKVKESSGAEIKAAKISLEAALIKAKGYPVVEAGLKTSLAQMSVMQIKYDSDARQAEQAIIDLRQQDIDNYIAKQNQLLESGVITEQKSLQNRIAFQQKLVDEITSKEGALTNAQLLELKKRTGYIETYSAQLKVISDKDVLNQETAEITKTLATKEAIDETIVLQKLGFDNGDKVRKEDVKEEGQALKDKKELNEKYWADAQTITNATFKVLGSLGDAFNLDMGKSLDQVQSLVTGTMKIFSNPLDISAWADVIATTVTVVSDAIKAITGEETEAQKKAREAREAEKKDIEEKSAARLATKVDTLTKEMNNEIAKARAVGATTRDIEVYYAREIARAKLTENRAVIAEQKKITEQGIAIQLKNETEAVKKSKELSTQAVKNWLQTQNVFRKDAWTDSGWLERIPLYQSELAKNSVELLKQAKEQTLNQVIELETGFALFSDRAEEASQGLGRSLLEGIKSGASRSDFKLTVLKMLQSMAIDAAVIAAGIGDKFNEIGAFIAESLRDGMIDVLEFANIDKRIDDLYKSATTAIAPIQEMFDRKMSIYTPAKEAGATGGTTNVVINSPIAVNPSEAAAIFKKTSQQMAFTGAF